MAKKIIALFAAAVAFGVAALMWTDYKANMQKKESLKALSEGVRVLETEKMRLQSEIDRLEREFGERIEGIATEEILVTELNDILYTDMYPQMLEHDAFGILALSEEEFPGESGKITNEQFKELLANGWSYCLSWNGENALDRWLEEMEEKLNSLELAFPNAIYIHGDADFLELDSVLSNYDISVAVCQWKGRNAEIVTKASETVWRTASYPWESSEVKSVIDSLVKEKGNIAFTVSFTQKADIYQKQYFPNMLSYIADYRKDGALVLSDFTYAMTNQKEIQTMREEVRQEINAIGEEIQAKIAELDRQIKELYGD